MNPCSSNPFCSTVRCSNRMLVCNGEMLATYYSYFSHVFWSLNICDQKMWSFILHNLTSYIIFVMGWKLGCALISSAIHLMNTSCSKKKKIISCVPVLNFVILHVRLYKSFISIPHTYLCLLLSFCWSITWIQKRAWIINIYVDEFSQSRQIHVTNVLIKK